MHIGKHKQQHISLFYRKLLQIDIPIGGDRYQGQEKPKKYVCERLCTMLGRFSASRHFPLS